ncbi:MAG: hypothetical protein Q9213_000305 [Squamulea squamosa]
MKNVAWGLPLPAGLSASPRTEHAVVVPSVKPPKRVVATTAAAPEHLAPRTAKPLAAALLANRAPPTRPQLASTKSRHSALADPLTSNAVPKTCHCALRKKRKDSDATQVLPFQSTSTYPTERIFHSSAPRSHELNVYYLTIIMLGLYFSIEYIGIRLPTGIFSFVSMAIPELFVLHWAQKKSGAEGYEGVSKMVGGDEQVVKAVVAWKNYVIGPMKDGLQSAGEGGNEWRTLGQKLRWYAA